MNMRSLSTIKKKPFNTLDHDEAFTLIRDLILDENKEDYLNSLDEISLKNMEVYCIELASNIQKQSDFANIKTDDSANNIFFNQIANSKNTIPDLLNNLATICWVLIKGKNSYKQEEILVNSPAAENQSETEITEFEKLTQPEKINYLKFNCKLEKHSSDTFYIHFFGKNPRQQARIFRDNFITPKNNAKNIQQVSYDLIEIDDDIKIKIRGNFPLVLVKMKRLIDYSMLTVSSDQDIMNTVKEHYTKELSAINNRLDPNTSLSKTFEWLIKQWNKVCNGFKTLTTVGFFTKDTHEDANFSPDKDKHVQKDKEHMDKP